MDLAEPSPSQNKHWSSCLYSYHVP